MYQNPYDTEEAEADRLDFERACKKVEQTHINNLTEGRRLKKSPGQINVLLEYFEKKPTWNYAEKVAIAVELDMTFSQVAKWNWDQRKKLGMPTERKKKKA